MSRSSSRFLSHESKTIHEGGQAPRQTESTIFSRTVASAASTVVAARPSCGGFLQRANYLRDGPRRIHARRSLLTAQVGTTARQLAARRCRRYLSLSPSLRRGLLAAYVPAAVGPQAPVQLSRPAGPLTAFAGHGGQPRVLRIVDVACLCGF